MPEGGTTMTALKSRGTHSFFNSRAFKKLKKDPLNKINLRSAMDALRKVELEDREKIRMQIAEIPASFHTRQAVEFIMKVMNSRD